MFASEERFQSHKTKGTCQMSYRCIHCGIRCSSEIKLEKHIQKGICNKVREIGLLFVLKLILENFGVVVIISCSRTLTVTLKGILNDLFCSSILHLPPQAHYSNTTQACLY